MRELGRVLSSRYTYVTCLVVVALVCGSCADPSTQTTQTTQTARDVPHRVKISEEGIRKYAKSKQMPSYPRRSLENGVTGVTVTAIRWGTDGRVEMANVLQAPDADIKEAVRDAVMQWEFHPVQVLGAPGKYTGEGRLTFYFQIADGEGRVLNPDEMQSADDATPKDSPQTDDDDAGEVDEAEFQRLLINAHPLILDTRDRDAYELGHRAGAVNIPIDELRAQAGVELPKSRLIVVDCSAESSMSWCRAAGQTLRREGFSQVVLLIP